MVLIVGRNGARVRTRTNAQRRRQGARKAAHWRNRKRIAALAFIGFCIAAYLAAYQFGMISGVWEPFFGNGSNRVLHSFISRMLPVPDAALGAAGYAAEFIAILAGDAKRYRTIPRLVLVYGALVAAMAAAALMLTGVQAFVLHTGCTLCLVSAAISVLIACLASEEVIAAFDILYEKRKT
jgi:uncharacterized membrane protein